MKNPTSKPTNAELQAAALQLRLRRENLPREELAQERLVELEAFIHLLSKTPQGKRELHDRSQYLGECKRRSGETVSHYYGWLRQWLECSLKAPMP